MRSPPVVVLLAGLLLLTAAAPAEVGSSPEAQPPVTPPPGPPPDPLGQPASNCEDDHSMGDRLVTAADTALDARDVAAARQLYERLERECPDTQAGYAAVRVLKGLRAAAPSLPAPPQARTDAGNPDLVYGLESYSLRTRERLRLTSWEKADFAVTSFLYGMSVGLSFSLALQANDTAGILAPIVLGAVTYTIAAVAYLSTANPDRGDLPLVLGIASYLPTTILLLANVMELPPNARDLALPTALAGAAAFPFAIFAANRFDLDPGDTQLVRDAGFWGMALGAGLAMGFGGEFSSNWGRTWYRPPPVQVVAASALVGLYGGIGLGILAAANSSVSLERVRVATWGGYGGAVLGALLSTAFQGSGGGAAPYNGAVIGAFCGLALTFTLSDRLDVLPEDVPITARFSPSLLPSATPGAPPAVGMALSLAAR
ncbi:MAG: hypothetical protein ACYC8T_04215 [Myxococcaceae bacterium]